VHLIGFIIRIYHVARSPERQISALYIMFITLNCYPLYEWLVACMCQWKAKRWKSHRNVGVNNGIKLMYYFIPFSPLSYFYRTKINKQVETVLKISLVCVVITTVLYRLYSVGTWYHVVWWTCSYMWNHSHVSLDDGDTFWEMCH